MIYRYKIWTSALIVNALIGIAEYNRLPSIDRIMTANHINDIFLFIDKILIIGTLLYSYIILLFWLVSKTDRPGWRHYMAAFIPLILLTVRYIIIQIVTK